ncbi:MAG TPA: SET domain-containing protein [Bacteroidota bacterium]|nr:SET domain-containing protein [Bacteroidota bacterium]
MKKESSIKPQPLISEILPGFATIIVVGAAYWVRHPEVVSSLLHSQSLLAIVAALGAGGFIASWIVGTFLDTCRDLIESVIDKWYPINWGFLLTAGPEDIERLNDWYLAYYLLNGNYVVGGLLILGFTIIGFVTIPGWAIWLLALAIVILVFDAGTLRIEMKSVMGTGLPHEGVYTRLGRSKVDPDGVGVLAIRDIKKGTYLFEPDDEGMVRIDSARVSELSKEIRKLYYDFGPLNEGKYGVPTSFNKLTVAWYVNESEHPNVGCDKDFRFYALTDIKVGDELTTDYDEYCERPPEE